MEKQVLNIKIRLDHLYEELIEARRAGNNNLIKAIEAEIEAINSNREFNRKDFLKQYDRPGILKKMRKLSYGAPWTWDGFYNDDLFIYDNEKPYEHTFNSILEKIKSANFTDLVKSLAEQNEGKPIRVLDLFGGAYFLTDLTDVSEIIGVRLEDVDKQLIEQIEKSVAESVNYKDAMGDIIRRKVSEVMSLIRDPKRKVILGNLYDSKTWKTLDDEKKEGFHLIVCRPQGPFGNTFIKNVEDIHDPHQNIARIFSALLQRSMKLLAPNGIAFIQFPNIHINPKDRFDFWTKFMDQNKNFQFIFDTDSFIGSSCCAIKRLK